jgi:hypothetical protein
LKPLGKVTVRLTLCEQSERFRVVRAHVSRDVVVDEAAVLQRNASAEKSLQTGARPRVRDAFIAVRRRNDGEIPDRLSNRGTFRLRSRPGEAASRPHCDDKQPAAVLGNPVLVSMEDCGLGHVAELTQRLAESDENGALLPSRQVRHVLEKHGAGAYPLNNCDEAPPEFGPRVTARALSGLNEAAELRLTRTGEGLAWDAPSDQVDTSNTPAA